MNRQEDVDRIRRALLRAAEVLRGFSAQGIGVTYKASNSPVTQADLAVDEALRAELPRAGEGWLSEESPDDRARLVCRRVWIVDPLDGTREFLEGRPHWTISIGLAEDGHAVAGGIYNPTTDEMFLGSRETGASLNGAPLAVSTRQTLEHAAVVATRWAVRKRPAEFRRHECRVDVVNAMAYSLALVAAGRADATWARSLKWEWDIAAGAVLVEAAGGRATTFGRLHHALRRFLADQPRRARR
jgi:myo-inositol-1(or 4)-monophosphatase